MFASIEFDPVIRQDAQEYLESGGDPFPNCAVLGASGLLGSYLLDFISTVNNLSAYQSSVIGFSRSMTPHLRSINSRPGVAIHDFRVLEEEGRKIDNLHIIHAASPASIKQVSSNSQSLIESNLLLTERLFQTLEGTGGRVTYFSSGEVYGNSPNLPTAESDYGGFDHLGSRGFYPEVKKFTELMTKLWGERTGVPVTILRIFHTFGPGLRADDNRIFADAIFSLVNGRDILLRTNGRARRSFMYTSDLANAVRCSWGDKQLEVLNVCGEPELSMLDFANLVSQNRPGCSVRTSSDGADSESLESPIMRGLGDTSRLRSFDWRPRVKIESAIAKTIESVEWRMLNGWS